MSKSWSPEISLWKKTVSIWPLPVWFGVLKSASRALLRLVKGMQIYILHGKMGRIVNLEYVSNELD